MKKIYKTSDNFTVIDATYVGSKPEESVRLSKEKPRDKRKFKALPKDDVSKFGWDEADWDAMVARRR
ncbi:MAG: hypothetical protein WCC48_17170 [Anaeromyxobacteraceae bacterium]